MRGYFAAILMAATVFCLTGQAAAELPEGAIGQVKTLVSGASVSRAGKLENAQLGAPVFEGDVVSTDPSGSIGITFLDGTVLSLGSDSRMAIDAFVFEPQDEKLSFAAKFLKGTATYLSGRIAKLSSDHVDLSTPFTTIGIRGTRVLIKVAE